MMTPCHSEHSQPATAGPDGARRADPLTIGQRVRVGLLAVALVTAGAFLPLWEATLNAPQYPGGLHMVVSGGGVTGDVAEIDGLNHYVGMRSFNEEDVPELALWPLAAGLAVVAAAAAAFLRRGWSRRAALAIVWLTPIGVLADIQFRLHQYGHDLDPLAALRIDEFTPLVIGPTKVWNFTTWARPGIGLVCILLAAALLTAWPRVARRWSARGAGTSHPGTSPTHGASLSTAMLIAFVFPLLLLPAAAVAQEGHGHGGHGSTPVAPIETVPGPTRPVVGDAGPQAPALGAEADAAGVRLAAQLADARPGQTILLETGSYRGNFVVDVPVTLDGQGNATLVTTGAGSTLTITAAGTVVRNLHVHGSGPGPTDTPSGIRIEADDVTIESSIIHDAYIGIGVDNADRVRLVANHVSGRAQAGLGSDAHAVAHDRPGDQAQAQHAAPGGRGDAISLWDADGVLVRDNVLVSARDGILVSFGSQALIDRNQIRDSRYAIHSMYARDLAVVENTVERNLSGLVVMYGGPALVLRNRVTANLSDSTGFGLLLKDVEDAQVSGNGLISNRIGIHVDGPTGATGPSATFEGNVIATNQVGVALYPSARTLFRGNSFHENAVQVLAKGRGVHDNNVWADRGMGNYWSSYRGYDAAGFGFGTVPHAEGHATDRLLESAPVLHALATSPAVQLLRAIEDRWTLRAPMATDPLPLMQPVTRAPITPGSWSSSSSSSAGLATFAVGLILASVLPFLLPRLLRVPAPILGRLSRAQS